MEKSVRNRRLPKAIRVSSNKKYLEDRSNFSYWIGSDNVLQRKEATANFGVAGGQIVILLWFMGFALFSCLFALILEIGHSKRKSFWYISPIVK